MKRNLVCVEWVDAEAEAGWTEDDPEKEGRILKTFGILVRNDDNFVVHASTYDPDTNRWSERGKIPKSMVKSIRVIEEVEV